MEWLQQLVDTYKSDLPLLTAFILGLMTAISPCPMATNITATAYLSKELSNKRAVLISGLLYTLGRMVSYTALGLIIYFGASQFKIARWVEGIGGVWLGVALILIGFFMLDVIRINIKLFDRFAPITDRIKTKRRSLNALLMGMAFALAFCPFSGVLYFGVLIPMTIASPSGLLLPPIFAIATGLPVLVIAWFLAYSVGSIGRFYNSTRTMEKWFKRIVALLFIGVGIYYFVTNI